MRSLLPAAIATGGEVTLQRIVGEIYVSSSISPGIVAGTFDSNAFSQLGLNIQMVATLQGNITADTMLDGHNASDLDSTNFLWRREYAPGFTNSVVGFSLVTDADRQFVYHPDYIVDVKTKRRFDRSQWTLALCATIPLAADDMYAVNWLLRGLFLTSGGI